MITYNICPMSGCHEFCIIKVHSRDNRIIKVESPELPRDPDWRCICLKALASIRQVYSADRLRYPMKRTGERGEGKWKRISWDEALDTIAAKILEIREKYGPQALYIIPRGSSTVGTLQGASGQLFANLWGSSTFEGKGHSSDGGIRASSLFVFGDSRQGHAPLDALNSRLMVLWSTNASETRYRLARGYMEAIAKGVRTIAVGPVYDSMASRAHSFIPARMGTDAALALAMINVIIRKNLYNEDFIRSNTVGPFLVDPKTGLFLRQSDLNAQGAPNRYIVWDRDSGSPVVNGPGIKSAISGKYVAGDRICSTAFQLLADRAAEYPLERAAEITGVDAKTIESFAIEYAAAKPASIYISNAMGYTKFGELGARAIIILGAITGNIGVRGGGVSTNFRSLESPLNVKRATMPPGAPGQKDMPGTKNNARGWLAIRDGDPYPVKGYLVFNKNPLQSYGSRDSYYRILKDMDLIVTCEIQRTMSTDYSDIVLPDATVFERDDIAVSGSYVVYQAKAVDPLPETRCTFEIWKGIAQRVGLGQYFDMTPQDFIKKLLDSKNPHLEGITFERLKEEGLVRVNNPPDFSSEFLDKKFPSRTGKIEIYVEDLASYKDSLPAHRENLESPVSSPLASKYPLTLMTKKRRQFTGTQGAHNDWLLELEKAPSLQMNPLDAQKRGISTGDRVRVFNGRGSAELKALLTEAVPPGLVNIHHGWAEDQFFNGHYNPLLRPVDDLDSINPSLEHPRVIPDRMASAHLIYNDVLCEVEKAK